MKKGPFIFILLLSSVLCSAADEEFRRYQIIIDKHPFGQEPPEAEIVQVPMNQSFARNLRLSMLFEGPDGDIRAGIIDNQSKKSYILRVGETQESGLELVEADLEAAEAMLRKGNEVALFKMESNAPEPVAPAQQSSRQSSYAQRRQALLQRIEERRAQTQEKKPAEPELTGEALKKHLEQVQMDAIRTGKPPLPLPLTPEMDAQLVAEGVLPPQ